MEEATLSDYHDGKSQVLKKPTITPLQETIISAMFYVC